MPCERIACAASEIEAERDLRPDRRGRKAESERRGRKGEQDLDSGRAQRDQDLDSGRAQGDQAEDTGPVYEDWPVAAATRYSGEDERDCQIWNRRVRAGHALRQACVAAGA